MGAVRTTALADLRRRRTQAIILTAIIFLASAAATLALNVLAASSGPFERAFASANGAHLVVAYTGSVGGAQVKETAASPVVTDAAGPWPIGTAAIGTGGGLMAGQAVSGRGDPATTVDAVTISDGRWWRTDGEVVIGREIADILSVRVGSSVQIAPSSAAPAAGEGKVYLGPGQVRAEPPEPIATLTVVGIAQSVSTPDVGAWLSPVHLAALTPDRAPDLQVLYRVDPAATEADLAAALSAIADGLATDALTDQSTYLEHRADVDDTAQLYVPILLAFAVFALGAAAFLIANAVSGVVLSTYRELGVLKALGFTPGQLAAVLMIEILVPIGLGSALGVAAGTLASLSTIERLTRSFGLPEAFAVSLPLVALVLGAAILISILAAIGPTIGAARISVVHAISVGAAPASGSSGGRLRRLGLRLPVTLPVRLGVGAGLAHPLRATMTLGALLVAVAAATFALSLNLSLLRVMEQLDRNVASPVRAQLAGEGVTAAEVGALIAANPVTERWVGFGQAAVGTRQVGEVPLLASDGDASWIGIEMIRGRWYETPNEVVAPSHFFRRSGLSVGDTFEISGPGGTTTVTLVGETFEATDSDTDGVLLRGAWSTLAAIAPDTGIETWEIRPTSIDLASSYASWLMQETRGVVGAYTLDDTTADEEFLLFLSVVALVGIVLAAVALGGVFNTVLLETGQRTREMAVLKALGLSPRQVVAMVEASVVPVGLLAGLLGVPVGLVLQRAVLSYMGDSAANTGIPESSFDVLGPVLIVALGLSGLAMAAIGAFVPAQRAARARIAPVLLAE